MNKTIAVLFLIGILLSGCARDDFFRSGMSAEDMDALQRSTTATLFARTEQIQDFLLVVDNSGSMAEEIGIVADSLEAFFQTITKDRKVDYRAAITTTNYFFSGGALSSAGGKNVFTSSDGATLDNLKSILTGIKNSVGTEMNSGHEMGLAAAERALTVSGTDIMRADVPLAVVILSDEDDHSFRQTDMPNDVQHYADFLKQISSPVLFYPIVGRAVDTCPEIAEKGARYELVSSLFGSGKLLSICNNELANSMDAIANDIHSRGVAYNLPKVAERGSLSIIVEGKQLEESEYDLLANNRTLYFKTQYPEGTAIIVNYRWAR